MVNEMGMRECFFVVHVNGTMSCGQVQRINQVSSDFGFILPESILEALKKLFPHTSPFALSVGKIFLNNCRLQRLKLQIKLKILTLAILVYIKSR